MTGSMIEREFRSRLAAMAPDAGTLLKSPKLQQFLSTSPQFSSSTYRALMADASKNKNAEVVAQVLDAFRAYIGAPAPANIDTTRAAGSVPPKPLQPKPDAGKMLKWSIRQKAFESYRAGAITAEQFEKIKQEFDVASSEGRVDFNA